jgi:hypothetical protein
MITNSGTAKQISDLMVEIEQKLAKSMEVVKESCSSEEYAAYHKAVGKIVSGILFEVVEPLYEKNPELKPLGWDDSD